ncbi:MAG: THUMP domain-containing protein [Candidatus Korarchaeota archaeon]
MIRTDVVITTVDKMIRRVLVALNIFADFRKTRFSNVIIGSVENFTKFCEFVASHQDCKEYISRIAPVEEWLMYTLNTNLIELIKPYIDKKLPLINDSFKVSCTFRGLSVSSHETSEILGEYAFTRIKALNPSVKVDLSQPKYEIIIESLGKKIGCGLITPELRTICPKCRGRK